MTKNKPLRIAIASGKGGTGKTLIATNLAFLSSLQQKTVLVDLDVEEPNDFIFINGKADSVINHNKMIPQWEEDKCTLCGLCSKICKYHAVVQLGKFIAVFNQLCHSCYACSELCPEEALPMKKNKSGEVSYFRDENLEFVEGRLEVGEEQAVPLINHVIEQVEKKYQNSHIQILDCPPGTSCPVIAATKSADYVILVTEPTPFGLNDLQLAVETMRKIKKNFGVVINRYGIGDKEVENYCKKEKITVLARINYDRRIAEDYSQGKLAFKNNLQLEQQLTEILHQIELLN
jgi:MinD superfamily P-loop ATPase